MADENDPKKKSEQADPSVIKTPKYISTAGSIDNFVNTGYKGPFEITDKAYNLATGATTKKDIRAGGILASSLDDATIHGARFAGVQRIDFATQSAILGASSVLGKNLVEMKINTIGDARNFMVGVNNVASVFSENSGLLKSIESASAIALTHGRITTEAIDRLNIPAMTRGIELTTAYHLDGRQMVKLSESVTTVLAYGKAVQTQFDSIVGSETYKNGMATIRDASATLERVSAHIPTYIGSEAITSPFVYAPQKVKIKEVEEVLPEVKKELPVKTTEAIELMEYVFDPSTKNDDKRIMTTVSELKRAIKNMQGSVALFIQQTTHKVEITAMPTVQASIEKSTSHTNKFPFKIPAGTTWQNIVIQFTDSNFVNIQVAGHSHQTGYADMGFVDKRTSKPTTQWALLSLLAKGGGLLPASSSDASDKYKKHKQLLSDKLKDYFNIEPDPFEPYKGGYKTRMTLVPPPMKQNEPKEDYSTTDEVEDIFRDLTEE